MAWDDAAKLPYASSRTPIEGSAHLLRVYRETMAAEQEELPEDITAHAKPVRAKALGDGTQTDPASWRVRVTRDPIVLSSLLQRGEQAPQITEVEVVGLVGRGTEAQRLGLADKDDNLADWRIAAFEITHGIAKKRRVKRFDPEHSAKLADWEGRTQGGIGMGANGEMPLTPSKQVQHLMEAPGFTVTIVWVDFARQEEPRRSDGKPSALSKYLDTGYFPRPFQEQRDTGLRIIKARLARDGVGEVSDLPDNVRADILAMVQGGMSAVRIAQLLDLRPAAVVRVVQGSMATETLRQRAARTATTPTATEAPKKPRAPRKKPAPAATTPTATEG